MRTPLVILVALAALAACRAPPMKDYAYPKWGFVADFWAPPEATETPAGPGQLHSLLLDSRQAGRDFGVMVTEGIRPDVNIDEIGPDAAHRFAVAVGGEVGPETYAATGQGLLGREYAITKNGKPFATVRTFVSKGRFYAVGAQSVLGPDDPAVKDFLDLFRITAAPPVAPPPANAAAANAS